MAKQFIKQFTPKAVEVIQDTLGITLTQEQIYKGHVEFPIKSRWPWKTDPAKAIIMRDYLEGHYIVKVTVDPASCPVYTDFHQVAKAVPQLKKACEALKRNY